MELRFTTYSNGETSARIDRLIEIISHGNSLYTPIEKSEEIKIGYHIFDTDFYKQTLKDIAPHFKTAEDLEFLNTKYKIPEHYTNYNDKGCKDEHSYSRSHDMGLWRDDSLSPFEKLCYFNDHKKDTKHTCLYKCSSEQDIAIAEFHYYITHDYKFTRCKMCGNDFFTKTLKNKYCQRIGENPDFPNYSCIDASRAKTKRKYNETNEGKMLNRIRSTLHRKQNQGFGENDMVWEEFCRERKEFKKTHSELEYSSWLKNQYEEKVPNGHI